MDMRDLLAEKLERARDEVRELKEGRQALYARIAALEERERELESERDRAWDRVLRERGKAEGRENRGRELECCAAELLRLPALEAENRWLRERVQELEGIQAHGARVLGVHLAALDDLHGYVAWHRHDGTVEKLVSVSEAEEVNGVISVSFDPGQPS